MNVKNVSNIQFSCPRCKHKLAVPFDKAGVSAPCPVCGKTINVPEPLSCVISSPADLSDGPSIRKAAEDVSSSFSRAKENNYSAPPRKTQQYQKAATANVGIVPPAFSQYGKYIPHVVGVIILIIIVFKVAAGVIMSRETQLWWVGLIRGSDAVELLQAGFAAEDREAALAHDLNIQQQAMRGQPGSMRYNTVTDRVEANPVFVNEQAQKMELPVWRAEAQRRLLRQAARGVPSSGFNETGTPTPSTYKGYL